MTYEHLRQEIIALTQTCPRREGLGLVDRANKCIFDYDRPNRSNVRPCPQCGTSGLVAVETLKGRSR